MIDVQVKGEVQVPTMVVPKGENLVAHSSSRGYLITIINENLHIITFMQEGQEFVTVVSDSAFQRWQWCPQSYPVTGLWLQLKC
jgi:hypothetical protein